ncbi:TetR/AcrR family transcriptional regulator [Parasphingorhabdus pacifica]
MGGGIDDSREPKRRGRRPNGTDTRAMLLEAARTVFIEQGYDGATVRAIATKADVDPAMVNHWFGGKEGLFTAAISIPIDPAEVIPKLLDGSTDELAERIVRQFLTVWDTAGGDEFIALLRSVTSNETATAMLRDLVSRVLFGKLLATLRADEPELRAALCGSQIVGLGMMRYTIRLEPLASADRETVVTAIAPSLQRYLTGDVTGIGG